MHVTKREAIARLRCGMASVKDLEFLGVDDVRAVKTDGDAMQYRFGERGVKAAKTDDEDDRTFEHYASTEHVDSMGDIIRVGGWDTKRLRAGRISLQWAHDYESAPLGIVKSAKRGVCDDGVKALVTVSRFHEADIYAGSEFGRHAQTVLNLVRSGDMPGGSVGFAPRDYRWPEPEEREALGMGPYGVEFTDVELLEFSITPVPANGRANLKKSLGRYAKALGSLVEAKQITQADMDELLGELAVSDEAWVARLEAAMPRALIAARSLPPWMAGTRSTTAPTIDVEDIASRVASALSKQLRSVVSQVSREIVEPCEDAINASVERLEAATADFERKAKRTTERVEVPAASEPNGSAAVNEGAGAGRSADAPSALRALAAALVSTAP